MSVEAQAVLADRLSAQRLAGVGVRTPEQAVGHLLAVQAQDPRGARLSIRARTAGVSAADVDAGFSERRTLLITWLNRGTLHLVQAEDYWWLQPLTTPQLTTGVARRLAQEGVSAAQADRGLDVIAEQVATLGPRTRSELRTALGKAGVPTAGQALVHILASASLRGDLVRGPMRGAEHCFVSAEAWLGARPRPLERPAALARLAHRYLTGHGPADAHDLAKWSGITISDAHTAMAGIADELVERAGGLVDLAERQPTPTLPSPRLLGPFDPLLHGWASRAFIVGRHQGIVTSNGLFRPFALVDGRAVATWGLARGQVTIRPLEHINRAHLRALESDAVEVLRFLHLPPRPALLQPSVGRQNAG
jgi:hypothetical protein